MTLISSKIKAIHKLLDFKQSDVSMLTGIKQEEISRLLNGKKRFLPTEYMIFLHNHNISLNWLIDDSQPVEPVLFTDSENARNHARNDARKEEKERTKRTQISVHGAFDEMNFENAKNAKIESYEEIGKKVVKTTKERIEDKETYEEKLERLFGIKPDSTSKKQYKLPSVASIDDFVMFIEKLKNIDQKDKTLLQSTFKYLLEENDSLTTSVNNADAKYQGLMDAYKLLLEKFTDITIQRTAKTG